MAEIVIPSFNIDDLYSVAGMVRRRWREICSQEGPGADCQTVVVTGGGSGLGRGESSGRWTERRGRRERGTER